MNIRSSKIDEIKIAEFTSTSGKYRCVFAEAYKPHVTVAGIGVLRRYDMCVFVNQTQLFKIIKLGTERRESLERWEELKDLFTAKPDYNEMPQDVWVAMPYTNHVFTMEEVSMLKISPIGARIFVRDIVPVDEVTAKCELIIPVVDEKNKPRPTMGIVIKVGNDPFIAEICKPGWIVMFSKNAGSGFLENGQAYRSLEVHEIIGTRDPADGIEDLQLKESELV